ncbi:MAG: hypothetical protein Q9167_006143 [Letrouitia subvulpina]
MPEKNISFQHVPTLVRTPSELKLIELFREYYENNKGGVFDRLLRYIPDHKLPQFLAPLHEKLEGLVTLEELVKSAKLSKKEHLLDIGQQIDGLTEGEKMSLDIQRSKAFWRESKDLLLTLTVCCLASMVHGWDQVSNGNLGWPGEFGIKKTDNWKFAAVQAIPWFSASFLGSYLSDPLPKLDDESRSGSVISPFPSELGRTSSWKRFRNTFYIPRIRRAVTAAMVVMIAQQLSGISIYAFLATSFWSTTGPTRGNVTASATCFDYIESHTNVIAMKICGLSNVTDYANITCYDSVLRTNFSVEQAYEELQNETNGFRFAIGFGAANAIFSCLAFFLVENKESDEADSKLTHAVKRIYSRILYFFIGDKKSKSTE